MTTVEAWVLGAVVLGWAGCAWLGDQLVEGSFLAEFEGRYDTKMERVQRAMLCVFGPVTLLAAVLFVATNRPYRGLAFQVRRRLRQQRAYDALTCREWGEPFNL